MPRPQKRKISDNFNLQKRLRADEQFVHARFCHRQPGHVIDIAIVKLDNDNIYIAITALGKRSVNTTD